MAKESVVPWENSTSREACVASVLWNFGHAGNGKEQNMEWGLPANPYILKNSVRQTTESLIDAAWIWWLTYHIYFVGVKDSCEEDELQIAPEQRTAIIHLMRGGDLLAVFKQFLLHNCRIKFLICSSRGILVVTVPLETKVNFSCSPSFGKSSIF